MKNLIKLQSILMNIEETMDAEFKSIFEYKDTNEMTIKTYCANHTIMIKMIVDNISGIIGYLKGNREITILDIEDRKVGE